MTIGENIRRTSMTDNEIINALECCCSPKVNACDDCPFHKRCYENNEWLEKEAIDLINRQKAEIERLETNCLSMAQTMPNMAKAERAEAVKEFAERFENKLNCILQHHFTLAQVLYDLDKTKKKWWVRVDEVFLQQQKSYTKSILCKRSEKFILHNDCNCCLCSLQIQLQSKENKADNQQHYRCC